MRFWPATDNKHIFAFLKHIFYYVFLINTMYNDENTQKVS